MVDVGSVLHVRWNTASSLPLTRFFILIGPLLDALEDDVPLR